MFRGIVSTIFTSLFGTNKSLTEMDVSKQVIRAIIIELKKAHKSSAHFDRSLAYPHISITLANALINNANYSLCFERDIKIALRAQEMIVGMLINAAASSYNALGQGFQLHVASFDMDDLIAHPHLYIKVKIPKIFLQSAVQSDCIIKCNTWYFPVLFHQPEQLTKVLNQAFAIILGEADQAEFEKIISNAQQAKMTFFSVLPPELNKITSNYLAFSRLANIAP